MTLRRSITVLALVGAPLLGPLTAVAQRLPAPDGRPSREVPGLDRIGVDEHLEELVPLDVDFRDHEGREVKLSDYFDGKRPVLLTFAYHSCPTLCSMVLDAVVKGISEVPWTAGDEYEIITISIDPRDTPEAAGEKRRELLEDYGRDSAEHGWHFLVGEDEDIRRVADAVGFRYFYDSSQEQYGHPAAIMFLTPDAKVARYLYGLEFVPSDIRMALLEASQGRSISTTEQILLYCYAYDPNANSYVLMATRVMQAGGVLTMLVLGTFLAVLFRRERRRHHVEP
jgi:protein SCO1/2